MLDQDNETKHIRNEQTERKELLECLALAYGITPGDSEGYTFNYGRFTQKEIAVELGYDNSTLGKMLKPDWIKAQNHSYKPLIACLRKQIEINRLTKEGKKYRIPNWMAVTLLLLLIAPNAFWLLSNKTETKTTDKIEKHIVETEGDFARLFSVEGGQEVANRFVEEFYDRIKDLRDSVKAGRMLTLSQKQSMITQLIDVARKVDGDVRDEMSKQGYFAVYTKEYNVVEIMDHITPRATLFKCQPEDFLGDSPPECTKSSDAHFDKMVWQMRDFLFNLNLPEEDYKKKLILPIRALQQGLSTEDMKVFKHFKETGDLIEPQYRR